MENIENIDVDFEISKAHIAAKEWSIDKYFGFNPFEVHAFYLMDYRQKDAKPRLITVEKNQVNDLILDHTPEVYASGVAHFSHIAQTDENTEKLAKMLCFYIKGTKTFNMWKKQVSHGARFAAVISLYGIKGAPASEAVIRPMMINTDETLLTPGEIKSLCDQLKIADKANPQFSDCYI